MLKMKRVLNKLLCNNYDCCHNCIFYGNCDNSRIDDCWENDMNLMKTCFMSHIYVEDEASSQ